MVRLVLGEGPFHPTPAPSQPPVSHRAGVSPSVGVSLHPCAAHTAHSRLSPSTCASCPHPLHMPRPRLTCQLRWQTPQRRVQRRRRPPCGQCSMRRQMLPRRAQRRQRPQQEQQTRKPQPPRLLRSDWRRHAPVHKFAIYVRIAWNRVWKEVARENRSACPASSSGRVAGSLTCRLTRAVSRPGWGGRGPSRAAWRGPSHVRGGGEGPPSAELRTARNQSSVSGGGGPPPLAPPGVRLVHRGPPSPNTPPGAKPRRSRPRPPATTYKKDMATVYPAHLSRRLLYSACVHGPLTICSAAANGQFDGDSSRCGFCAMLITFTSINYWRHPLVGLRRSFDIGSSIFCFFYQLRASASVPAEASAVYCATSAGILCSYAFARHYNFVLGRKDVACRWHLMVHACTGLGSLVLYDALGRSRGVSKTQHKP
jgi:hypothetical protein